MLFQPPVNGDISNPDRPYVNPNPANGIEGSIPPAEAIEQPMREIVHAITYFLGTPEIPLPASGEDLQQLRKAIQQAVADGMVNGLFRDISATLAAGFWTTPVAATVADGDVSFNTALGNRFTLTATEALTITAPDPMPAGGSARLELTIDGTGNYSIDFGAGFRVNHGQISSEPNAVNLIHMEFSGALIDVHITQRAEA
ncbi:hypothetical protein [Thalassospira lucentensis]|uniref:hypothetical protein n=1 Tax=Thalassospira lucentensis TaxID=168935 RepID=UPI003D27EA42